MDRADKDGDKQITIRLRLTNKQELLKNMQTAYNKCIKNSANGRRAKIRIRRDKTMRKNFGAKPFLYPQPVMILGTYDENGKANAMNAAWGGIVGANEIIVDLSAHKTTDNIIKNKAFTVGVVDLEHLVACDYVGIVSANKEA